MYIPLNKCSNKLSAQTIDGKLLVQAKSDFKPFPYYKPWKRITENTLVYIRFLNPLILGYPWLSLHNQQFSGISGHDTCCSNPAVTMSPAITLQPVNPYQTKDLSQLFRLLVEYLDQAEVFDKQRATVLPLPLVFWLCYWPLSRSPATRRYIYFPSLRPQLWRYTS